MCSIRVQSAFELWHFVVYWLAVSQTRNKMQKIYITRNTIEEQNNTSYNQ